MLREVNLNVEELTVLVVRKLLIITADPTLQLTLQDKQEEEEEEDYHFWLFHFSYVLLNWLIIRLIPQQS